MKPRLRKINGLWHCAAHWLRLSGCMGIGYTPEVAYADWERQTIAAWHVHRAMWAREVAQ